MGYAGNTIIAVAVALSFAACTSSGSGGANGQEGKVADRGATIDETTARDVARKDAMQVYRDLSIYRVKAELKDGNWYVDYELEGEAIAGGGPHYVISGTTGAIIDRRYEQ